MAGLENNREVTGSDSVAAPVDSVSAPAQTASVPAKADSSSSSPATTTPQTPSAAAAPAAAGSSPSGARAANAASTAAPAQNFVPTRLAPAPVPVSSPWGSVPRRDPAPVSAEPLIPTQAAAHAAVQNAKKDTKEKDVPKQRTTGKEKWVPYTPVVTTSPPTGSAGSNNQPRQKQKPRKQNNRRHDKSGNNSGNNGHNSNGSGASSDKEKASEKSAEASGSATPASPRPNGKAHRENGHANGDSHHHHHGNYHHKKKKDHEKAGGAGAGPAGAGFYNASPAAMPATTAMNVPPFDMTLGMLVQQMEYYFSIENLCKDLYLRRQMNSQGLVPVPVLANFNRVRTISGGNTQLVVEAARWAPSAEVVGNKVRLRNGWERWVLPASERLEAGRSDDDDDDDAPKFSIEKSTPFVPKTKTNSN